jgi:putative hydrolase of HD superfamily
MKEQFFSMENNVNFLIEIQKLKETPRTGWVLMKVKNPETIAEHIFQTAFLAWLLGREKGLNVGKIIKIALSHDLCEVYAGDRTPFFYWDNLNRDIKEDEKMLLKGIRLSKEEKEKRAKEKSEKEKESLLKLLSLLKEDLRDEIFSHWLFYERRIGAEGNFAKQVDRIMTLIPAILYFGPEEVSGGTSWWELTEEIVEDELLIEFLKVIQKKFYGKVENYKRNKRLEAILDFIVEIGKLKRMPRLYWLLRGIKNPETVAGHIFTLAIMAWIFGKERNNLNQEKL